MAAELKNTGATRAICLDSFGPLEKLAGVATDPASLIRQAAARA